MRLVLPDFSRLIFAASLLFISAAADWPQWRGPDGQGHAEATNLPVTFSDTENVVWRTPLPGRGWSSPVIAGNQIWMTTAIEKPVSEEEKARRVAASTNSQPLNVVGSVSLRALGVDRASGKLLHDIELMVATNPEPIHTLNTYASPSPVLEDGHLYCHFGSNGTACLDTKSGKVVWTNRDLHIMHENGAGSTPVLWHDLLIFHCDGSDAQYVAALDKKTGKLVWKTNRSGEMDSDPQMKKSYGTPLIADIDGQTQLISPGANWLYSYDPQSGREQWKVPYGHLGFSIAPRPVAGHNRIYMSTGFMQAELLAVEPKSERPEITWRSSRQAPNTPSPLLVGDELYMVSDRGMMSCLDANSGETIWTERLGGDFSSSPISADGHIYVGNHDGMMSVVEPGKTPQIVGTNQLDSAIMATPAAVDHELYVRTEKSIYRFEK